MKTSLFGVLSMVGLVGATIALVPKVEAGYFTYSGQLQQVRVGHTATLLPSGKVLVVGGTVGSTTLIQSEIYESESGTWSFTGSMTNARSRHTATLLLDGKVLVVGGSQYYSNLASAEVFDPVTETWNGTGYISHAREGHTATLLPNGSVLIAGGWSEPGDSGAALAEAELFDPAAGTWTNTGAMNLARGRHTATLLANGKVLVCGGQGNPSGGTTPIYSSCELYDPGTGVWTVSTNMNVSRELHSAVLLTNGQVLVACGDVPVASASSEKFDPGTEVWSTTSFVGIYRNTATATLLENGKVLLAGGTTVTSPFVADEADVFDCGTGVWLATGNMLNRRSGHTATLLPNGKVLIAGGINQLNQYLQPSELYEDFDLIVLSGGVLPDGSFRMRFDHTPGLRFTALFSTNVATPLINWVELGEAEEIAPGQFQFTDEQATNSLQRFYRVRAN